jgi:protein involved in polysaccharide export with SLBB domain
MSKKLLKNLVLLSAVSFAVTGSDFAQTTSNLPKSVNFSYSQNPKTKAKIEKTEINNPNSEISASEIKPITTENTSKQQAVDSGTNKPEPENTSIAKKTLEIAKRATAANVSPTEIYKVGVADILFINLQNAPANSSNYFTVLNDGTIDYPLAGQMVSVIGKTSEEIEDSLKEKIKLVENPQISVRVRERASHSITVLGLVEKPGEKFLLREAMPLYYVRAEAVVQSKSNLALIKHVNSGSETIDLNEPKNDNVLIFPGDIVEFKHREEKENSAKPQQFFYIGGGVMSGGQKDFHQGMTITQAILASGGLRRSSIRKIIVRRKNSKGLLIATEVNLKAINDGKEPDFILESGDTIEVGN